jgi:hypothetical protein
MDICDLYYHSQIKYLWPTSRRNESWLTIESCSHVCHIWLQIINVVIYPHCVFGIVPTCVVNIIIKSSLFILYLIWCWVTYRVHYGWRCFGYVGVWLGQTTHVMSNIIFKELGFNSFESYLFFGCVCCCRLMCNYKNNSKLLEFEYTSPLYFFIKN